MIFPAPDETLMSQVQKDTKDFGIGMTSQEESISPSQNNLSVCHRPAIRKNLLCRSGTGNPGGGSSEVRTYIFSLAHRLAGATVTGVTV